MSSQEIIDAIRRGDDYHLKSLVSNNMRHEAQKQSHGLYPIEVAIQMRNANAISIILSLPFARCDMTTSSGVGILAQAAATGDHKILAPFEKCSSTGQNQKDPHTGDTALHIAVALGAYECVKSLLNITFISANIVNKQGLTPLLIATQNGDSRLVELLAQKSSSLEPNAAVNGWTAMMIACYRNDVATCQALGRITFLSNDRQNNEGWCAASLAAQHGNPTLLAAVNKASSSGVNIQNDQGWTALMIAANAGDLECVQELRKFSFLTGGASTKSGQATALMLAAQRGDARIVEELKSVSGIAYNAQDSQGWTALMFAVQSGQEDCVNALASSIRVNAKLRNHQGQTARDIAVSLGYHHIAQRLPQN